MMNYKIFVFLMLFLASNYQSFAEDGVQFTSAEKDKLTTGSAFLQKPNNQPTVLTFSDNKGGYNKLWVDKNGKMNFEGDATEAAKEFVRILTEYYDLKCGCKK